MSNPNCFFYDEKAIPYDAPLVPYDGLCYQPFYFRGTGVSGLLQEEAEKRRNRHQIGLIVQSEDIIVNESIVENQLNELKWVGEYDPTESICNVSSVWMVSEDIDYTVEAKIATIKIIAESVECN